MSQLPAKAVALLLATAPNMLRNRPNLLAYGHRQIAPAHKAAGIRTPVTGVRNACSYLSTSTPPCIFTTCSLINRLKPTCCEMQQNTAIISPNKINCLYIRDGLCSLRRRYFFFFFFKQAVSCRTLATATRVPAQAKYVRFVAVKWQWGRFLSQYMPTVLHHLFEDAVNSINDRCLATFQQK